MSTAGQQKNRDEAALHALWRGPGGQDGRLPPPSRSWIWEAPVLQATTSPQVLVPIEKAPILLQDTAVGMAR